MENLELSAISELRNNHGKVLGQVLFGKPEGGVQLEERDTMQIEVVLALVAAVINDREKRSKTGAK